MAAASEDLDLDGDPAMMLDANHVCRACMGKGAGDRTADVCCDDSPR